MRTCCALYWTICDSSDRCAVLETSLDAVMETSLGAVMKMVQHLTPCFQNFQAGGAVLGMYLE